jgi:molybdenum cofactor guanylyltransferase
VILAGGQATRYGGRPKGLEVVGSVRVIDRVAAALSGVTSEILLLANDPEAASWMPGVPVAGDVLTGQGSLGGIHAALARAGTPVLVVAWDMPFVPGALLGALLARGEDHDVAVPESGSRRGVEPMCAFYGQGCLPEIERCLAAGDRRVISFFDAVRVARLGVEEVSAFGDPAIMFMNVNTPEDLILAESHATAGHDRRP